MPYGTTTLSHTISLGDRLGLHPLRVELAYSANHFLRQATGLLRYARFAPNHPAWPQYEAIVTEAIRAVQTYRLTPPDAVQYGTTRLRQQLRHQVRIVD